MDIGLGMENHLMEEQLVESDLSKSEMVVFGEENVPKVFPNLTISVSWSSAHAWVLLGPS